MRTKTQLFLYLALLKLSNIGCISGSLIVVEVAAIINYWPDLPRVSGAAYILSANITHGIKLANLIMNRDMFLSMFSFFFESLSQRNLKDSRVLEIITAYEKKSFRDLAVITSLTGVAVFGLVCVGDLKDPSGLPLVAWYPFEINYSPVFELVYIHQMLAVFIAGVLNVTLDLFTTMLIIQLCCQFKLLKYDIHEMGEIDAGEDEGISIRFYQLIERHCVLKEKCNELSQMVGITVMAQFLCSVWIICITFYQFSRTIDNSYLSVIATIAIFIWALLQAFFYCYYGNEIKIEVIGCV